MGVIQLRDFQPATIGAGSWMAVQRAWERHPERRPQLAANLRRLCRAINGTVVRRSLRK